MLLSTQYSVFSKLPKKEPTFVEISQTVRVTFPGQKVDKAFKALLDVLSNALVAYLRRK